MNHNSISILGVRVDALTIEQANSQIERFVKTRSRTKPAVVVKPYVEFLVSAHSDPKIAKMLNAADLSLADGISLQWAASFLYGSSKANLLKVPRSGLVWLQNNQWRSQILPEKMAGVNQTTKLLEIANKRDWKVGIIGGKNSPEEIRTAIHARYPNITELYCWSGYLQGAQENQTVQEIASKDLDVLFVAMGFPRQEEFIFRNIKKRLAKVLIGEGGSFDYEQLGGSTKRAPVFMQKSGTEWLWRLALQPKRITRHTAIPKFVLHIKRQAKEQKK